MERDALSNFETLILIKVKAQEDIINSEFIYESGDFKHLGFNDMKSFNHVIQSIYRSAPICEGIGYYEYCNQIRESIYFCLKDGKRCSFVIPFRKDETNHYFLMNVNRGEGWLYVLFIFIDDKTDVFKFEDFSYGAFKDSLTGLFNYRTLISHIAENKRDGFLILFDLNKFKEVNDFLGHETGDAVIKAVAKYLISIASMREVFYRRSGDEFMILVFEQDMNYVLNLINNIEKFLESIPQQLGKDFHCSAAFGILELAYDKHITKNFELQSKLTDLAMYQAKKAKKLYHFISFDDSVSIVEKGDLDKRIKELGAQIKR